MKVLIWWLYFLSFSLSATTPDLFDEELKAHLHKQLHKQKVILNYNVARRILFGELHLERVNGQYAIFDVYCEQLLLERDFKQRPPRPGQVPDPRVLNTEHTWPQSRFSKHFSKRMQKSDLHILFPVMSFANISRSNYPFGDVDEEKNSPCPAAKRGFKREAEGIHFEVPERHKGNVARAMFYFSVRYLSPISTSEENSLRAWHRLDPVDEAERKRNDAIFAKQKVRNPFIDQPELVDRISDF